MPPAVSAGRCPSVSLLTLPASWADTWNATQVAGLVFFILLSDNFHDLSAYQPERAGASTWSQDSLRTADRILDMTEMFLARSRRFPSDFWVRLSGIVEVLIAWFFPETRKSHRTCGTLEVLLAVALGAKGLLWLRARHWTSTAADVTRLLSQSERDALLYGCCKDSSKVAALQAVVDRQRLLIRGVAGVCAVYQWWSPSWRYTGFGKTVRESLPLQGGLSHRLLEHLYGTLRPDSAEAYKVRYRLARRTWPTGSFFLLATHGPEAMMRATEYIDIVTHRPISNGAPRIAKPGRCRARSRPPRTQRSRRRDVGDDRPKQLLLSHEVRFQRKSEASQRGHQPFSPWTTTFAQVYVHEQKKWLAKDGSVGPLWLYASNQRTLFMSYIARKNSPFDWEKAEAVDPLAPVKYALLLRCFRSHYRRVTARQALDPWLHARGFPSSTMQTICVSHKDLVSSTHLFLKDCLWDTGCPLPVRRWLASRFRIIVTRPTCFKDDWNHASTAKRGHLPDRIAVPSVCEGPMSQIKKNWQVPKRCSPYQEMNACQDAVFAALRNKHVPLRHSRYSFKPRFHTQRRWQSEKDTMVQYLDYTKDLHIPLAFTAAPDDKNKKWAWTMPSCTYVNLMAAFALSCTSWYLMAADAADTNRWLCGFLVRVLGSGLAARLGVNCKAWLLPFCYVTVKSKCWQGAVRVCAKTGHSCVRKVLAYSSWTKKRTWRSAHRALDTILKHHGDSCDTWSLADATKQLKEQLWCLPQNPSGCCQRCFRVMQPCEAIVGDAGQFFEVVTPSTAIQEAQELMTIFASQAVDPHVTVCHHRKRIAWFGRQRFCTSLRLKRAIAWHCSELMRVFIAAVLVCVTSVGDRVFGLHCLPIGGLMSKFAACVTLAGQERRWRRDINKVRSSGFCSKVPWTEAVCHLRYVDDIFLASCIYCANCLQHACACIYSVPFDFQDCGCNRLQWLDMLVAVPSRTISLHCKPLAPPPAWGAPPGFLRCVLVGKFKRWAEIDPPTVDWQKACISIIVALRDNLWSKCKIYAVLYSIRVPRFYSYVCFLKFVVGQVFLREV